MCCIQVSECTYYWSFTVWRTALALRYGNMSLLFFFLSFLLLLQQCSSVPVSRVTRYQWFPCTSRNFNGNSLYIETMLVVSLHVDSIDTIQCMTRDVSSQYIFMAAMAKG